METGGSAVKIEAKVKNPESVLLELTIEMNMAEWDSLVYKLDNMGSQGELKDKIRNIRMAMGKVVSGEDYLKGSRV